MNTLRWGVPGAIALVVPLFMLGGCYTQFGSSRYEDDPEYVTDNATEGGEVTDDSYYDARDRFYDDSYYPGYTFGFGFGWSYPPYGWGMDPYSSPYGGYYPGQGWGRYAPAHGGRISRRPSVTRGFGSDRTLGVSRGSGSMTSPPPPGYVPLPSGVRQAGGGSTPGGSAARPGISGGRRGTESERRGPAATPSSRGRGDQRPARAVAQPRSDPSREASTPNPWGNSGGGVRSSDRPAERSAPPPSQPAPSGGSRGSDSRGSGNSRGGDRH